jgi:alanyl-tRNA synthetase
VGSTVSGVVDHNRRI